MEISKKKKDRLFSPDQHGSMDWMSSHEAKDHRLDSGSGYMPRLQANP